MLKNVSMTEVLKNPSQIRSYVEKGFTLHVFYKKKCVFDITAPKITKQNKTMSPPPRFDLGLPLSISKKNIYEKYGKKENCN